MYKIIEIIKLLDTLTLSDWFNVIVIIIITAYIVHLLESFIVNIIKAIKNKEENNDK